MMRILMALLLSYLCIPQVLAHKAGFLWYTKPDVAQEHKKSKSSGTPFHTLSYTTRDAILRFYTMEALHKVRFTHRIEDEHTFLSLQDYWLREASLHGKINQEALLRYPEFDYSVTHPTSQLGLETIDNQKARYKDKMLHRLSKHAGLLFFYRGRDAMDLQQIPILKALQKQYPFALEALSMDGVMTVTLPTSKQDHGQAHALGINYFPAVVVVNPKTQVMKPIAFGLVTQDVLRERLVFVAKHTQGVL